MVLSPAVLPRSWAWPVATLVILAAGCTRSDDHGRLVQRAERSVERLGELQPRLAKAGTPDAEALADRLAAVREGLAALPAAATAAPGEDPPPPAVFAVRCPDAGAWRVTVQAEAALWRLELVGGGVRLADTGPAAVGLALAVERARPIDPRLELGWGIEAVGTVQDRTGGQRAALFGVRPVLRAALAVHDRLALTARPIVEVGQAEVNLGAAPGGILDKGGVYAAVGVRGGLRWHLGGGDLTAEAGWRQAWFNATAGEVGYRATIGSPEAALGWSVRF